MNMRISRRVRLLSLGFMSVAVLSLGGWASAAQNDAKTTPVLTTDSPELKWAQPGSLPPGAQATVLASSGDWRVVRVKMPPHYLIPPHSHPDGQAVWLVSGTVVFGFGDTVDKALPPAKPGAFFELAPGDNHWILAGDDGGVFDAQESNPGGITYVNPADDPRPKK